MRLYYVCCDDRVFYFLHAMQLKLAAKDVVDSRIRRHVDMMRSMMMDIDCCAGFEISFRGRILKHYRAFTTHFWSFSQQQRIFFMDMPAEAP